jgi:hypothetical protein
MEPTSCMFQATTRVKMLAVLMLLGKGLSLRLIQRTQIVSQHFARASEEVFADYVMHT